MFQLTCISSISALHMEWKFPVFIKLWGKQSTQNCLGNCWIDNNLSVRKEIAGKKWRFEQDQPEVGDKKKKNR